MGNKYINSKILQYIFDFFSKGHPRSLEAKKNIAASFIIKGINILISLALVPLTIHYVNSSQYGIWLALSSIVAWFSFFDIGFGQGLRNRFAEAMAKGDPEKARIYVSTTYAVLVLIFSVVWILFSITNYFLNWSIILNVNADMGPELTSVALIVFSFFCLQFILKTINIILIADQKPAKASFLSMLGQLVALIIIYVLTQTTQGSLIYLSLALGCAPLVVMALASFWYFSKKYKYFRPSIKYVNFNYTKDIMSLGLKFFLIQFASIFVFQATNIIIIQILNPEQVTIYDIAYKYFFVVLTLVNIIVSPFWSAFTEAYTIKDFAWMKSMYKKLNKVWYVIVVIIIFMLAVSNLVFKLWIGNVIVIPISVSILMAINSLSTSRFNIFISLLNGIGKVKLQLYIILGLSLIFVPLSLYLGNMLGLNGIIISNIFISTVFAIIVPMQVRKILEQKAKGILNK